MTDVPIVDPGEPSRFSRAESFVELLQADMERTRSSIPTSQCLPVPVSAVPAPGPAFLPGKEK